MPMIFGNPNRPVLSEPVQAGCHSAQELPVVIVQTLVAGIGAGGLIGPFAELVGRESETPGPASIPKAEELPGLSGRRGNGYSEGSFLHRIGIGDRAPEREFKPPPF